MPGPSISACASSACTARRPSGVGDVVGERLAVEQHSALDAVRVRVVGGVGLDLDDGAEVVAGRQSSRVSQPRWRTDGRCGHVGLLRRRGHVQVHRARGPRSTLADPSKTPQDEGVGHPYRIREIAVQAGLSEATVDRVLQRPRRCAGQHRRRGPPGDRRPAPAAHRSSGWAGGRSSSTSSSTPRSAFSSGVRAALEAELPGIRPAVIRSRFHLTEAAPVAEHRRDAGAGSPPRGSQGVVLKAPDDPRVVRAVERLVGRRHPGGHLRDGPADQPARGLRRHRQPGGRRDRRIPDRPVARRRPRQRARHARRRVVPR